jgi:hypothetical protein
LLSALSMLPSLLPSISEKDLKDPLNISY